MSKHTPGPWVFDTESGGYPSWVEGPEGAEVISGCGCCGSPNLGIDDARLICAAPDLLADLAAAAEILRRYEGYHRAKNTEESNAKAEVNAELAARFEATIAKARGEQ